MMTASLFWSSFFALIHNLSWKFSHLKYIQMYIAYHHTPYQQSIAYHKRNILKTLKNGFAILSLLYKRNHHQTPLLFHYISSSQCKSLYKSNVSKLFYDLLKQKNIHHELTLLLSDHQNYYFHHALSLYTSFIHTILS